jgi:hypothetical protein
VALVIIFILFAPRVFLVLSLCDVDENLHFYFVFSANSPLVWLSCMPFPPPFCIVAVMLLGQRIEEEHEDRELLSSLPHHHHHHHLLHPILRVIRSSKPAKPRRRGKISSTT